MKTVLFLFLFISRVAVAQEIALLDRAFKNPMALTQKLTIEQLGGKQFPVYKADLEAVIRLMENLSRYINTGTVHETATQLLPAGHSNLTVAMQRTGAYCTYTVFVNTRSNDIGASLEVVKSGSGNKKALQQLQAFLDYLKNNRHIITAEK